MADSAERLLRLLGLLQRRSRWAGAELASRLGVDTRTVRRDVERLRGLGYQVDASPGAAGGYRLRLGPDVPLPLEDDEALAVAVLLGTSAGAAVPGIDPGVLAGVAKLDGLLPPRLRRQLTSMRAATESLVTPSETVSSEALVLLARACDAHQRATFSYLAHSGRRSDRRVEPHRLVATDRRWYLVAYDLDRADWRTFRVDRASSVQVAGHTFEPRPLVDAARMVAEGITNAAYEQRAVVRVRAAAPDMARRLGSQVGIVEPDGDGCRVELGFDDVDWVAGYLVGLGVDFEVVEPVGLRRHVLAVAERLVRSHRADPGDR